MNCQEVIDILDNHQVERLDPDQRRQVEAHVAVCADCARIWHAQASLATLPDIAMTGDFPADCRLAVAAGSAAGASTGRRVGRRALVWGSLAAIAAAAATLALLSAPSEQNVPTEIVQVTQTGDAAPVAEPAPDLEPTDDTATEELQTTPEVAVATPRFTVRVVVPETSPADPASPFAAEQKALYATGTDPAANEALQSLGAALVAELRKVPGLAVVQRDPEPISPTSRHYRVRIGHVLMIGLDGKPMRYGNSYSIGVGVQEVQSGGATVDRRVPIGVAVDPLTNCTSPEAAERMPCDAPMVAAFLAGYLRQQVFPPDTSVTQPLLARLQDSSMSPADRFQVLADLYKQQKKVQGTALLGDRATVRAAVELAQASDAAQRARIWRVMRGVGDPTLLDPLLASLQQDPENVRIAALETLAADFSDDQRARAALETASLSDPRALVRAVAQRGLSGEAGWRTYVVSSLKDSSLPDSERVGALLYELYPPPTVERFDGPSPSNYWDILKGLDEAAVRSVADVFPRADVFRNGAGNPGNNFLANFAGVHNQNPAVTDMLLTVLEQDSQVLNRAVAAQVLAAMHASEPRVRVALLKAVKEDPAAMVRDDLEKILQSDRVKKAMEAATQ